MITTEFKDLFNTMIDSMLEENGMSTPCKVVFENSGKQECPNCEIDPLTKRSSSIYKTSGPVPFIKGQICPYCGGEGYLFNSNEEDINLMVVYDFKYWVSFKSDIKAADGMIQTISPMSTIAKIRGANKLIVNTSLSGITRNEYTRHSDPEPAGLGRDDYIFTFWKKI